MTDCRCGTIVAALVPAILESSGAAVAHVTLEIGKAPVASYYKAILRVPHGCKGSATIKLTVEIPPGVVAVKPQPKPGWQIGIVKATYAQLYDYHGSKIKDGVKTLTWSGGRLPDDYYDEFVFTAYLTKTIETNRMSYFPTVQTCEIGEMRWTTVPAPGKIPDEREGIAPGLMLLPARAP